MYRTVECSIYTDPKFKILPPDGKLLFLYLFTNSHSHVSGIYHIAKVTMEHETGISRKGIDTLLIGFERVSIAFYDHENEVIWVTNMLRYQATGPKCHKAVEKQLQHLHNSPLIKTFIKYYTHFKDIKLNGYRYPIDTLSITYRDQEQEQEQEQKQYQKQKQEQKSKETPSAQRSPLEPLDANPEPPKKTHAKDEVYEIWAAEFLEHRKVPYQSTEADFVRLAVIRKAFGINSKGIPVNFESAVHNYFASPLSKYTLADMCSRYDVFINNQLDRYGKPAGFNDVRQANQSAIQNLAKKGFFDGE